MKNVLNALNHKYFSMAKFLRCSEISRALIHQLRELCLFTSLSLSLVGALAADQRAASSPDNSIAEQFKSFISSPPLIEELIFESKKIPPRKGTNYVDLTSSTNFQRYIARWQQNALSVYQVFPDYVTTNIVMNWYSISVFDRKHWHIVPSGTLTLWYNDGKSPRPKAEPNTVADALFLLRYRFAEVLNMGVFNLDIGSIRWQGNSFTVTNAKINLKFVGTLIVSEAGVPVKLQLRSEYQTTNVTDFEIFYSFDRDIGLPYVPHQIRSVDYPDGKLRERALINIWSIKPAQDPADETAFLPRTNLLAVPIELRHYTNGAYYALDESGRLIRATPAVPNLQRAEGNRRLYLATSALLSIAIFALVVRAKLKSGEPKHGLPAEPKER